MTFDLADTPLVTLSEGVLTLPISLEGKGNSLDSDAVDQASVALRALLAGDIEAGAVLLVGLGANFCAGGNVPGFAAAPDRAEHVRELADRLHAVVRQLDELPVPIVAAVAGWAAGADAQVTDWVLDGGEDHGLLGTFPPGVTPPAGFTVIGTVRAGEPGRVTLDGEPRVPGGWDSARGAN